ncbi:MAG: tetratricopeptide repeat-containing sensor histidine kinase [Cytophagales bacterium]|nr:tetratricopeptide repeat-containing sensor histidine kinase [Cytophagales bacterium]
MNIHLAKIIYPGFIFLYISSHVFGQESEPFARHPSDRELLQLASDLAGEGDIKEATRHINSLGMKAWENKDFVQAIDYFNRSIELNGTIGNESGISKLNSNLGMIYADLREYEKSLSYFDLSLKYRLSANSKNELIATYINKAVVLNNLKRYDKAAAALEKALSIATEMNDISYMKSCYGMLAETYEKSGNQAKTMHYFDLYRTFHEMIQREKVNRTKRELQTAQLQVMKEELSRKEKEIELLEAYKKLNEKEEVLSQLGKRARQLMETNSKQQLALSLLESENKLDKAIIHNDIMDKKLQKNIIWTIATGLVLSIWLTWFFYRNNTYKRKLNDRLLDQNEEIKTLNNNLESQVKARTEKLRKAMHQLKLQNSNLQQFSSVISHNLRAPIASIMGLNNIINLENPSNPTNFEILKHIRTEVNHLDVVVQDLSFLMDIRDAKDLPYHPVKVSSVFRSITTQLGAEIKKSGVQITLDDAKCKEIVTVKPYFESILYNLTSNAIKYRSRHAPCVRIKTAWLDRKYFIEIIDNGIGIHKDHLSQIFLPYKRFNDRVCGKGLGLYIVKEQIDALSGEIDVSSELNKGTTFSITFPTNNHIAQ